MWGEGEERDSFLLGAERRPAEQRGGEVERGHPEAEAGGHGEESEFYFHCHGAVSEQEGVLMPSSQERGLGLDAVEMCLGSGI